MVKVLIVNDNIDFCQQLETNLNDVYEIYFAHNCEDALKISEFVPIDLVIATLDLPQIKLSRFIGFLRDKNPETRIIGISEQVQNELHIASMIHIGSLGVNRVLKHPFKSHKMLYNAVDQELSSVVELV